MKRVVRPTSLAIRIWTLRSTDLGKFVRYVISSFHQSFVDLHVHLHNYIIQKECGIQCSLCSSVSLLSVKTWMEGTYDMPYKMGGGGGRHIVLSSAASLESRASPEKADERGGGGVGGPPTLFPDLKLFGQFSRHRVGVPIVHHQPL